MVSVTQYRKLVGNSTAWTAKRAMKKDQELKRRTFVTGSTTPLSESCLGSFKTPVPGGGGIIRSFSSRLCDLDSRMRRNSRISGANVKRGTAVKSRVHMREGQKEACETFVGSRRSPVQ